MAGLETGIERFDVAVIGAGLIGSAVAWELTGRNVRVVVLEARHAAAAGVSGTNSGLLCTGFDAVPGTLECAMIRDQAQRWPQVFEQLDVPYRIPGALVLAGDDTGLERLTSLARNALENGVQTTLLDAAGVASRQPGVRAPAGLLVPGEAITDPYELVTGLLSNVGQVRYGWPVQHVVAAGGSQVLTSPAGQVAADFVVNCAGLYADEIAADGSFTITPRRGSFLAFGPETRGLLNHIILPVPTAHSKGVLLFPTVHDRVVAGPTASDQADKEDWRPREEELAHVRASAEKMLPSLGRHQPTHAWTGLRTVGQPRDYFVEWSPRVPRMLSVAGIRSTGLSSCLGLSGLVANLLAAAGLRASKTGPAITGSSAPRHATESVRPWWERLPQTLQRDRTTDRP